MLRNHVFLGIAGLNVVFVTAGYAQIELLPVFAKNEAGVSEREIGLIFFLNTVIVAVAQLPVAKLLEGRQPHALARRHVRALGESRGSSSSSAEPRSRPPPRWRSSPSR